jgi:hypothetical protein
LDAIVVLPSLSLPSQSKLATPERAEPAMQQEQ